MSHKSIDISVASQIGLYSDAIEVGSQLKYLFTSGTPGLSSEGMLPDDITAQAELAWDNIRHILDKSDMTIKDIVKVTQYLTRAEDIRAYAQVRNRVLGDARPASMLLIIPQLVKPEFLVEIEIIAAK